MSGPAARPAPDTPSEASAPTSHARLAGGLWLLVIAAGIFALTIRGALIVGGDPAATAANIRASEPLFRLGVVADLVSAAAYVGTTFLLYGLLRPVSSRISLFAALLGLAGSTIMVANLTSLIGALSYLQGPTYLAVFEPDQREALALLSLGLHGTGYNISMVVFAAHLMLLGWLVLRSTFLPSIIGVLLLASWLCGWFTSLALFLSPSFARQLFPYILIPNLLAEGGFALWLLICGARPAMWQEQAARSAASPEPTAR